MIKALKKPNKIQSIQYKSNRNNILRRSPTILYVFVSFVSLLEFGFKWTSVGMFVAIYFYRFFRVSEKLSW